MENIVEKYIDTIQFILSEVKENYQGSLSDIDKYNKIQEDIEHDIELNEKKNRTEGYKAYRQLRQMRQERRASKNQNELLKDLYSFFDENKQFFDQLAKIKGNARKVFDVQNTRQYRARVIEDASCKETKQIESFDKMLKDFKQNNRVKMKSGKLRK